MAGMISVIGVVTFAFNTVPSFGTAVKEVPVSIAAIVGLTA